MNAAASTLRTTVRRAALWAVILTTVSSIGLYMLLIGIGGWNPLAALGFIGVMVASYAGAFVYGSPHGVGSAVAERAPTPAARQIDYPARSL
jgi:hypothetical protein